jgi:hypothetical protein
MFIFLDNFFVIITKQYIHIIKTQKKNTKIVIILIKETNISHTHTHKKKL